MKVLGYIPLHYGAEYLEASISSMINHVDKLMIVYTPNPSQGHGTLKPCPETEDQLKEIALKFDKVEWHKGSFGTEGDHRAYVLNFSKGYDLVFTLDADEIVDQNDIPRALKEAYEGDKRHYGIAGFINFWRSFNFACYDGFLPYRIINLHNKQSLGQVDCKIYHFSTAQKIETVRYKWEVSGHANELKPNWIDSVYLAWTPENQFNDLHPVSIGLWNATPFDKNLLPDCLKNHPNFHKHII